MATRRPVPDDVALQALKWCSHGFEATKLRLCPPCPSLSDTGCVNGRVASWSIVNAESKTPHQPLTDGLFDTGCISSVQVDLQALVWPAINSRKALSWLL